jgi:hypothetical protein
VRPTGGERPLHQPKSSRTISSLIRINTPVDGGYLSCRVINVASHLLAGRPRR